MAGQKDDSMAEVAIQYNDSYSETNSFASRTCAPRKAVCMRRALSVR